jgi:hypothetical protein
MTKLIVQNIISQTGDSIDFKDRWTANNSLQWLDTYGVIKTHRNFIDEDVTIPSGTNGMSAGTITVGAGKTVTVQGEWRII